MKLVALEYRTRLVLKRFRRKEANWAMIRKAVIVVLAILAVLMVAV